MSESAAFGDTVHAATGDEVKELRREARTLKEQGADLTLEDCMLFAGNPMPIEESSQHDDSDLRATLGQQRLQPDQRDTVVRLVLIQDRVRERLDPSRLLITALRIDRRRAVMDRQLPPRDRARCACPELLGGAVARHPFFKRSDDTILLIIRSGLNSPMPVPFVSTNRQSESVQRVKSG